MRDYIWEPYHNYIALLYDYPPLPSNMRKCTSSDSASFFVLPSAYSQDPPLHRFSWSIRQMTSIHSGSAITPSKKVQLTLTGSPLCAFQWAQDEHRTLSLSPLPLKGAQNRKTADFCLKSHFVWRLSATEFLCVKTVCSKVVGHSLT